MGRVRTFLGGLVPLTTVVLAITPWSGGAVTAHAQRGSAVEPTPIACWWRSSRSAVTIGERFTVTLTCALRETERDTVVVDPNQLDASALALAPFEVVSGRRHPDVVAGSMRHVQYEYLVRIMGPTAFGQDVDIPALSIKYSLKSSIGATEGREQTYVLPTLPVRVLSLVPAKGADIRDSVDEAFRGLETRRRRARLELMAAAIAFAFAAVLLALALIRWVAHWRARRPIAERVSSPTALIGAAERDARRLAKEVAREGWTADRAARALTALRVVSAVGLDRPVMQLQVDTGTPAREGQLALRSGLLRRRQTLVSAAASAPGVERRLTGVTPRGPIARDLAHALATLQASLGVFTRARYAPADALDGATLDAALEAGVKAARRVRWLKAWPLRALGLAPKLVAPPGVTAWTR